MHAFEVEYRLWVGLYFNSNHSLSSSFWMFYEMRDEWVYNNRKTERLYSHDDINNYDNNNAAGLCSFWYERVYSFLPSILGHSRRETQIIRAYANHTMLISHYHHPHHHVLQILWCLRSQLISTSQDPNWIDLIRSEKLNSTLRQSILNSPSFLKSQNSPTISSGLDVIHPLNSLQRRIQPYFLSGSLL